MFGEALMQVNSTKELLASHRENELRFRIHPSHSLRCSSKPFTKTFFSQIQSCVFDRYFSPVF